MVKYFIGYNENDVIRLLCVRLPQVTDYPKKLNENVTMSFRANNKQISQNYNKIWKKIEKLLTIDFESKPIYGDDDKYIKRMITGRLQIFITKKYPKKKHHTSINNFRRMQICARKDKN